MPQGRRKVPFSNKQKKQQLQEKRERRRGQDERTEQRSCKSESHLEEAKFVSSSAGDGFSASVETFNHHTQGSLDGNNRNRYRLHFTKLTREEVERNRLLAFEPLQAVPEEALEVSIDDIFLPGSELDIPKRPHWDYNVTKQQLESKEHKYFTEYIQNIHGKFGSEDLSYLELNLETWRQLWRVMEMSDVLLVIVDIRYAALLFPPALYDYVKDVKKAAILILNKIDLAPPGLVAAWKGYFQERFPGLHVVCFTSFPGNSSSSGGKVSLQKRRRRCQKMAGESSKRLLRICEEIVSDKVDLSSWSRKIEEELAEVTEDEPPIHPITTERLATEYKDHTAYEGGVLTIGCVGFPNVGKSSVLNALMGKKVVSVSRTPGHTKHFQTIFLTPTVKLCDCPGLVFPSKVSKPMQILAGSFPIAQVQEPYTAIRFIAERLPLPKILQLQHPNAEKNQPHKLETAWSPYDICDAWALKRGFFTAKMARNDTNRAGNHLLRLTLEGKICLCLRPPNFKSTRDFWETHPSVSEIKQLSLRTKPDDQGGSAGSTDGNESSLASEDTGNEEDEPDMPAAHVHTTNKFALLEDD